MIDQLAQAGVENVGGVATLKGLEGIFANALAALLGLSGILLFIMLVWGGIQFITGGGDPKTIEQAKRTLTYAIGGMVLLALSYLFLRFIGVFTGNQNILNFRIGP
jgi:hypothetical protein